MNTATYRAKAREAENQLNWSAAAEYWQQAIDAYPITPNGASLANADITNMKTLRDECSTQL